MPETLQRDLEAYRLQVAQVEIARNRLIALDLLVFNRRQRRRCGIPLKTGPDVRFMKHTPAVKQATAAGMPSRPSRKTLPLAWLEAEIRSRAVPAVYAACPTRRSWTCWPIAWRSACSRSSAPATKPPPTRLALSLTGADVAAYWRPTVANYLGRITRDQLLALGRELLGEQWAQSRHKDKKGELAAQLERAFAEPEKNGRTPQQLEKLTHWLPEGMAFTATAEIAPAEGEKSQKGGITNNRAGCAARPFSERNHVMTDNYYQATISPALPAALFDDDELNAPWNSPAD